MVYRTQRNSRRIQLGILLGCLLGMLGAGGAEIHYDGGQKFSLTLNGRSFLTEETPALIDLERATFQEVTPASSPEAITVLHGGARDGLAFYREVAARENGIEVSWFMKMASRTYGKPDPAYVASGAEGYSWKIPLAEVMGGRYQVADFGFRGAAGTVTEGTFESTLADGEVLAEGMAYVTLTTPQGEQVTFDFNPVGPHNMALGYLGVQRRWTMRRSGAFLELCWSESKASWGHTVQFKVQISASPWRYEEQHLANRDGYINLVAERAFYFGPIPHKALNTVAAGIEAYDAKRGWGWLNAEGLQLVPLEEALEADPFQRAIVASGSEPHTFRMDLADGLYLVHVAFCGEENPPPFDLTINGTHKWKAMVPRPQNLSVKSTYGWAKDGRLTVGISGESWKLAGLAFTPLLRMNEDYFFHRTWWSHEETFLAWQGVLDPVDPLTDYPFEAPREELLDWAWNTSFETLEASINTSWRTTLETPEAVGQRLEEIARGGYRGVVYNGAHFRVNYMDKPSYPILLRNSRLATETAHRLGLRVISHHDLTWVMSDGYPRWLRLIDEDPDVLPRSVTNPFTVQASFCLNSPAFLRACTEWLEEHLRATGMDGYMVDEMTFYPETSCGCDRCRKLFERETGLRLPRRTGDADGLFFRDAQHPVWRAWGRWKGKHEAAFVGALKNALRQVNPNLVWTRYTSSSLSYPSSTGLNLNDHMPWNADHIGDEFHPDDILHNWRIAFARFKNRQGTVRSWGNVPTWYLAKVASDRSQVLYAWAIARMNRGNLWRRGVNYDFMAKLNLWPDQMNDRDARPLSEVALLLSQTTVDGTSRLTRPDSYYDQEHVAWLQTMAEMNIQHDVLLERDILLGRLDAYPVLVLANTAALPDAVTERVLQFVENGGRVIAVFETGMFGEDYAPRGESPFIAATGLKRIWQTEEDVGTLYWTAQSPGAKDLKIPALKTPQNQWDIQGAPEARELARFEDGQGVSWPGVVEAPYGQGRFIFIAGNYLSRNYEPKVASVVSGTTLARRGATYTTDYHPALDEMVADVLTYCIGETFHTRALQVPRGVIYAAFRQTEADQERILLHLLNLQGRPRLKAGDDVHPIAPIPTPPVKEDVMLSVRSSRPLSKGVVCSPLAPEHIPVTIVSEGADLYTVRIPAQALKDYALVRLEGSPE